jgi:hypothetical protein
MIYRPVNFSLKSHFRDYNFRFEIQALHFIYWKQQQITSTEYSIDPQ